MSNLFASALLALSLFLCGREILPAIDKTIAAQEHEALERQAQCWEYTYMPAWCKPVIAPERTG